MKDIIKLTLKVLSIIIVFVFGFNPPASTQTCKEVLKLCPPMNNMYNKQSLQRSYKILPQQKLKIVHVFYGSTAYNINICKQDSLGDFRVKILDYESGKVFWDNIEDDFTSSINISFGSTKRIIIEAFAKEPSKFNGQRNCVGLVIRYHRDEEKKDEPVPSDPPGMF